jgi:KaiC/GvpD/RAD55 family RecA-like ATPase
VARSRLLTGISQAFWCDPTDDFRFKPASLVPGRAETRGVAWLDELFCGGLVFPDSSPEQPPRSLTMVLSGPPGTGKSTLALELCWRCAQAMDGANGEILQPPMRSWYVASEVRSDWLIDNAKEFRWTTTEADVIGTSTEHQIQVMDMAKLESWHDSGRPDDRTGAGGVLASLYDLLILKHGDGATRQPKQTTTPKDVEANRPGVPAIIVIDSLNTIESKPKADRYREFMALASSIGPKLIVAIVDSGPEGVVAQDWEFAADIVLRLGRDYEGGYLLRTVEIVKARFQQHVWGKHQLKIYSAVSPPQRPAAGVANKQESVPASHDEKSVRDWQTGLMRSHPFREQGGVFIFPSLHYHLSLYKKLSPSDTGPAVPSPVHYVEEFIGNGFPRGRCTALIGGRGTHKSHFGYLQVLDGLMRDHERPPESRHERALVISLRDDEGVTRHSLEHDLLDQWDKTPSDLRTLERSGVLEITYFPPGLITPEEFMHRVLLSIHRFKRADPQAHVSVLFNSLDQLPSRFPLCASQRIFIPAVISALVAERATSYFVVAQEKYGQSDFYGLDSIADLILEFNRKDDVPREHYFRRLSKAFPYVAKTAGYKSRENFPAKISSVEVRVERFAGGLSAGSSGLLDLVHSGPLSKMVGIKGLIFVPNSDECVEERQRRGKPTIEPRPAAMRNRSR